MNIIKHLVIRREEFLNLEKKYSRMKNLDKYFVCFFFLLLFFFYETNVVHAGVLGYFSSKSNYYSLNIEKSRARSNQTSKENDGDYRYLGTYYNQNTNYDPAGWIFSGPLLDAAAAEMSKPYYNSVGIHSIPRNYINYDWGW